MQKINIEFPLVCAFCGGIQREPARCEGCGAAPGLQGPAPSTTNDSAQFNTGRGQVNDRGGFSSRISITKGLTYSAGLLLVFSVANNFLSGQLQPPLSESKFISTSKNSSINSWHTANSTFQPYLHSHEEIRRRLAKTLPATYKIHYVGIQKSANKSRVVTLNLTRSKEPVVLILSSYDAVSWVIDNKYSNSLPVIIYGSNHPGSSLSGDISADTIRLAADNRIGDLTVNRSCDCTQPGLYQCTGNDPIKTINTIESLSGATPASISIDKSATALSIPQRRIDKDYWLQRKIQITETAQAKAACMG